jgi:hypothetical protein
MRSVVKHSYMKGMQKVARAKAHVNYIQYRNGEDRGKEPRAFFDEKREGILGREVKEGIEKDSGKVVHKLILSPGVEGVDVKAYTRQVMHDLGREKGLDLNWAAVVHTNTDNPHAHVVVMGKDQNGREVQLRLDDCRAMRESGDRYLARHHEFDRYKDREIERVLKAPDYSPEGDRLYTGLVNDLSKRDELQPEQKTCYQAKEWDKEKAIEHLPENEKIRQDGNTYTKYSKLEDLKDFADKIETGKATWLEKEEYQKLYQWIGTKGKSGEDYYEKKAREKWDKKERKKEKKKERQPGEDEREFKKLDKDLKKSIKELDREGSDDGLGRGYRERQREQKGRMGAEHGHTTANKEIERLKQLQEAEPNKREELDKEIEEVKAWDQEQRQTDSRWKDLDSMLGDRYGREQKERAELLKPHAHPIPSSQDRKDQEQELGNDKGQDQQDGAYYRQEGPDLERGRELDSARDSSPWKGLDSMLGERFGRDQPGLNLSLEQDQSAQQMRQFQDMHMSQEQTPKLEPPELNRDDGEDHFARGER